MAEREVLVDKMRLTYEGLFSIYDMYKMIDEWFEEKGYDKREVKNIESVFPEGKYIEVVMEPWKKLTDYAKSVIKVRMIFSDIKEVQVEKDGMKVKMNQGRAHFVFDAFLETDYENRWESKPMFFLIRTLYDKYFYKGYTSQLKGEVMDAVTELHARIKGFLNLHRY
ncbi:MAG: hypothetical protein QF632_01310 [Candidatus Woesearchaeota archaeon]|jgi:hypothetical protein|nr:hypothetical protein [Candidatus Woesearchaeota archaeon]MDP7458029.1 hypothetical protein [Candidatus Woesearchaeota archaeon]